jgi:flagellar hook-associated protein 1 FlgK
MASTFGGIQQAGSALNTARYGLDIVSQNIANADTPGYTRQAVQQASVDAAAGVPSIYTRPAGPGGVVVTGTARMTDVVLVARLRTEQARSGYADTTATQLGQVQATFAEPSDSGLSEQLNDFWNAWGAVANDPGSPAPRTVLLARAETVASTLNSMSGTLADVAQSSIQALGGDIAAANSAATQLATVNKQIAVGTATGSNVNSLLDQRDQLLSKLSTLVGGVASLNTNGSANVTVGGQALVSGNATTPLSVGAGPSYQVQVGATAVTVSGGSVGAEVTALTTTYPAFQAQLDAVADSLVSQTNAAQTAGYDLSGAAGQPMFSGSGATGISVSMTNPAQIAASGQPGGNLDAGNALAASRLGTKPGGPDSSYRTMVAAIGSATALAQQQQTTQAGVTSSVADLATAVSGVNTDEEVSAMLTYQHAFEAASRVLTTVDSILDTLINHTGLVGRG